VPKLYHELAEWWPLLSAPTDYAEEAEVYRRTMVAAAARPVTTLLELGSGGGNNASFLKQHFRCTLVDLSPEMLRVSQALNPECEHILGDMRSVRLGRRFDAVFVHDAIGYMTSEADLRRVFTTAHAHLGPGGVALFAPDTVRERFVPVTDHGGSDDGKRALRYLDWIWDPDPEDTSYVVDFAFLLRENHGPVRVVQDRHELGLFRRDDWLAWIAAAGFEARAAPRCVFEREPSAGEVFLGVRPDGSPDC
jgi:SAM-dependent methyltransferase